MSLLLWGLGKRLDREMPFAVTMVGSGTTTFSSKGEVLPTQPGENREQDTVQLLRGTSNEWVVVEVEGYGIVENRIVYLKRGEGLGFIWGGWS